MQAMALHNLQLLEESHIYSIVGGPIFLKKI